MSSALVSAPLLAAAPGAAPVWDLLAVRLPLSKGPIWKGDRITILQGLQVLDGKGEPTRRLDVVKAPDPACLAQDASDEELRHAAGTASKARPAGKRS